MATLTITYDAHNSIAQKTIDYILSLGLFTTLSATKTAEKASVAQRSANLTRKAIEEAESGDVVVCSSFDDFLARTANA